MRRPVGLVDPGLEVQIGDAHIRFRRHFHRPELRLVMPAALAHRPGTGDGPGHESRHTNRAVERLRMDRPDLNAAIRPGRQEGVGMGKEPLGQNACARPHGRQRQTRAVLVVIHHPHPPKAAGKHRHIVCAVCIVVGNFQSHRDARPRIRRQDPLRQLPLRHRGNVPPEGRLFTAAIADTLVVVPHAGLVANRHARLGVLDATGVVDVALHAQGVAGVCNLAVRHLIFKGPAKQLDVVHAEGTIGVTERAAMTRSQYKAHIDAGNICRNYAGELEETRTPLAAAQIGHFPRRPGRVGGKRAFLAGHRPLRQNIGEAVTAASFCPREDDVLGCHQRQLELDPRHIGRAKVPMGTTDVTHVELALVGLPVAIEHVVFAGAAGVHNNHFIGVDRRPGDGGIGQQAAPPRLRGFRDRAVGEAPRAENHLVLASLLAQFGVGGLRANHQGTVGAHRRHVHVVVVDVKRDETAQADDAVVGAGRRHDVRVAYRCIEVPHAEIPLVGLDHFRVAPRNFGIFHALHDIAVAIRPDAADVQPFIGVRKEKQGHGIVSANVENVVGTKQIRPASGNHRIH